MRSPFKSGYTVTQPFGVNGDYYRQFGLKAHEGIDLIPKDARNTAIYCLADGIVVRDDDIAGDPRTDAYGIFVTIWHPQLKRATQYCHLANNTVSNGQQVKVGEQIGTMGSTGNVDGAHLHLNLFETDDNGIRLNRDNGYLGGTDPQPFLDEPAEPMATITQKELDEIRLRRDELYNENQVLKETIDHLNTTVGERQAEVEQLKRDLKATQAERDDYQPAYKRLPEAEAELKQAIDDRARAWEETDACKKEIERLKNDNQQLIDHAPAAFLRWVLAKLRR